MYAAMTTPVLPFPPLQWTTTTWLESLLSHESIDLIMLQNTTTTRTETFSHKKIIFRD